MLNAKDGAADASRRSAGIYKGHKRGCDAKPGATGNHYCGSAVPSASSGTQQTQNGARGCTVTSAPPLRQAATSPSEQTSAEGIEIRVEEKR